MADEFLDELEQLVARRREREREAETQQHVEERFDRLEAGLSSLADSMSRLVAGRSDADGESEGESEDDTSSTESSSDPADEETVDDEELPLERVVREPIPLIYDGEDEPETVRYIDVDTGEERTRKGRKKGGVAAYRVEVEEEEHATETEVEA